MDFTNTEKMDKGNSRWLFFPAGLLLLFMMVVVYLHSQTRQLKIAVDPPELPKDMISMGVTLEKSVSEKDAELEVFDISYGESKLTLNRYLGSLNAIGTTYVFADIDQDSQSELILIDGYEYSSSADISLDCSNTIGQTQIFGIHNNYVVYDFEGDRINKSCNIPPQYTLYFSFFRGWLFSLPEIMVPAYLVGILGSMALIGAIAKPTTKPMQEVSAENQPRPQNP